MIYKYETATGTVEIEVSQEWFEKLQELDRLERNNNQKHARHQSHIQQAGSWMAAKDEKIEALFHEKSREEKLHEAIEHLDPSQKDVIMMFFFEGKKQAEIAILLGISQQAVSKRLKGAEKNIKNFFENGCKTAFKRH